MGSALRPDLSAIASHVRPNSRVLDIGCGNGDLMYVLEHEGSCDARGIEIDATCVERCVARGLSVVQGDADSDLAKAGFTTLKYKSADVIFDDNTNFATTGERAYFLNTDYLKLYQHREAQWTMDDAKTPVNQDAVVVPLYWQGNLVLTNRSLQGLLFDAA